VKQDALAPQVRNLGNESKVSGVNNLLDYPSCQHFTVLRFLPMVPRSWTFLTASVAELKGSAAEQIEDIFGVIGKNRQ
jgi:hypothetical protein